MNKKLYHNCLTIGRSFKLNSKTTRMEYFGYFPAASPKYTIVVVIEKDGMPAADGVHHY